jgi:hypothetical protein
MNSERPFFVHAYHGSLTVIRLCIEIQDVFHGCHKITVLLGRDGPAPFQVRLK